MDVSSIAMAIVVGEMNIPIPGVENVVIGDTHSKKVGDDVSHMAVVLKVVRPVSSCVESPGVPNLVGSICLVTELAISARGDELPISMVALEVAELDYLVDLESDSDSMVHIMARRSVDVLDVESDEM